MSELNIQDLGYEPIQKAPSQNTFNGIGTRLYGNTAIPETDHLYSKVMYFTILYIPIFALAKYLACFREGNEYILGKGKLSGISKAWNMLLIILAAGAFSFTAYNEYVNSPEYIAKNLYNEALELIEDKQFADAISNLKLVHKGGSSYTQVATKKLDELISDTYLKTLSPSENYQVVNSATKISMLASKREELGIQYFEKFVETDPKIASDFADLIVSSSNDENIIKTYEEKNYNLLKMLFSQQSGDYDIALKYAALEERYNQCEMCIDILEPHFEKLGLTEGARILGQSYAAGREVDKAYKLLSPYVENHLSTYHLAEKNYNEILQKVWDDSIEELNSGKARQSFYTEYDMASKERQGEMVDEYYISRRDTSAAVDEAKGAYFESTKIVPVALDLGMVLLNRASMTSSNQARITSLEQAEKIFLSVQNYAGDSDEYQLYLGQVYYWLGKESKGDELFSALIEKYNRSHQVLNSLSSTLRDLGAFSKAKEYALEAYSNASELKDKQVYAQSVALLSDGLVEKIEWLEKADQNNAFVRGDLLTAKGRKASDDNELTKALGYFQDSIAVYEKIPESASQLNNIALIYLSKYQISYDESDFNASLNKLDQAVNLLPEDSIILGNAASQHFSKAYHDTLKPYIDFKSLEITPRMSLFSYLYKSNDEKSVFRNKLSTHSSFKQGLSYLEKAVLLAPKSTSLLDELTSVYRFMDDQDSIINLASRTKELELDTEGAKSRQEDYRNEVNVEENLIASNSYIALLKERVTTKENLANKINQSILQSNILTARTQISVFGQKENTDDLIRAARENVRLNDSIATRSELYTTIIHHLLEKAKVKVDGFADFHKEFNLIFNQNSLFCLSLNDPGFKRFVESDPLSSEIQKLIEAEFNNFPTTPSLFDWKILNEFNSPLANKVAKELTANPIHNYRDELAMKRTANNEFKTYMRSLKHELQGDLEKATNVYQAGIQQGLKLPSMP